MTLLGNLQYDNNLFDFEETNIYGIFEPYGYMSWYIEMFPIGEDNYLMFSSLILEDIFSPQQLSGATYKATADTDDLYEHTVRVNGKERVIKSINMTFGKWDNGNQSIQLIRNGIIKVEDSLPEVIYKFNATLKFTEINIFETTKVATQQFIETHLKDIKDKLTIKFENAPSGIQAIIQGKF